MNSKQENVFTTKQLIEIYSKLNPFKQEEISNFIKAVATSDVYP